MRDDEARTMALTLLRAVGNGVRAPEQQVEGQMLGQHVFEFALYPHSGDWEEAGSDRQAHAFNAPLAVGQSDIKSAELPEQGSILNVNDAPFVLSALKLSEDGSALIARGFNISTGKQTVKAKLCGADRVELVDLKEDSVSPLTTETGSFSFEVSPKQIITCRVTKP